MLRALSWTALSADKRMICSALPIGASGLRSSCASVARKTSFLRSASRSDSSAARRSRSATSRSVTSLAIDSTDSTSPSAEVSGISRAS